LAVPVTSTASAEEPPSVVSGERAESHEPGQPVHRLPAIGEVEGGAVAGCGDGSGLRIAVACSRFNGQVTRLLLAGALAELDRCGVAEADRTVVFVPGAFELPLAAMTMAGTHGFDAVVCLGAVIRGETSHYDFVAGQCAAGLQRVQLDMNLPVVFGVLTTENLEQALARAGGALGNKGTEAAATAIEMATLLRRLANAPDAPPEAGLAAHPRAAAG
jgi:6,7-dimethyl-8-ribityllumazine synthase